MDYNVETTIVDGTFQHQKRGGAEDMIVVFLPKALQNLKPVMAQIGLASEDAVETTDHAMKAREIATEIVSAQKV
jgi:hypothetical protein